MVARFRTSKLAQCILPLLLIHEKSFVKFAVMQSQRNIVSLKGITGSKSTQIKLKSIFCMLPNATQNFKLQRPDLESRRAEAMLRLFIAEHCFTVAVPKLFGCWAKFAILSASAGQTILCIESKKNTTRMTLVTFVNFLFIFFAR